MKIIQSGDHYVKPFYKHKVITSILKLFLHSQLCLQLFFPLHRHVFPLRRDRVPLLLKGVDTALY